MKQTTYQTLLFDLDGTLTDPGVGITNSVSYALQKFGITVPDRKALYSFIGPPLHVSFQKFYGFSEEEARLAIRYYREYFSTKGMFENRVYPGIPALLSSLKSAGYRLMVATSKPSYFSEQILAHFELDRYFSFLSGATMDETRTEKADVIAYALRENNITDKKSVLMIGDRKHDILGARENAVDSCGVLYGYGTLEELTSAGARYLCKTVDDLLSLLTGEKE